MGRTFTPVEADDLELMASEVLSYQRMYDAYPQIAPQTALYDLGSALEEAYEARDQLFDETLDINSPEYALAEEECKLVENRRGIFAWMVSDVYAGIKFKPGMNDRVKIFENTVTDTLEQTEANVHWKKLSVEAGAELCELAAFIGDLLVLDAAKHFQTV